jgi:hypothetical protein
MRLWSMPKSAARLQPPPKPELPDDTLNPPPKQLRNLRMAVMVDPCTPSSCDVQAGVDCSRTYYYIVVACQVV